MSSSPSKAAGIEVRGLSYAYGGLLVLQDISISVPPGRGVAVLGPSGCGKSTLMHIVSGLLDARSGEVLFEGKNRIGAPGWISYMQQDDLLLPWKRVGDNIALPLILGGMKRAQALEKVRENLEEFGLEGFEEKYPSQLSGGMRQRAAFMRACMLRSDFLLLDEPFSKLDFLTQGTMHNWFQEYHEHHKPGFVLVTHDPEEALLLADEIILLSSRPARIIERFLVEQPRPRSRDILASEQAKSIIDTIIAKAG